ncbi:carbohydrate kinase family protein [Aestuariivirga sp.]|uniref:carbohydrate kinase family protein n=1 Tax=Aestuariivirga sp. TaxID=2650926 RepID=UPI0025BD6E84|nr:sugar kinase [Aestuariivirga sp.]MCA3554612.1 sugar kinase [Aestuariivirga sp.]
MPRYDYVSMGFYTYDCLGWPFTEVPAGGGTAFIDELTLAVSGAGGTASIAAARMGLATLAVAGVGDDLMGDWVLQRLRHFGVDTWGVQREPGWKTSSSIVTTRADGSRPALHMKGATANFFVTDEMIPRVTDTRVFHAGGVGLMDAMDKGQTAVVMKAAKARGATTTVDVFAGSPKDLPAIAQVLPYTDYFMPSIEEAQALCGRSDHAGTAAFFLDMGVKACVLTLGGDGAYYHDRSGVKFHVPAYDIKVKCTCGCGDAFDAGFAVALVQGFDMETAVRFAQATSALNATGLGSQAGVRDFAHTLAFMKTTKTKG